MIDWGKDGTPERLRDRRVCPRLGKWVRLEVPVARLGIAPGTVIDGWAFTQHGGTVYWDKAGIETETPQDGQLFDSFTAWVRAQRASRRRGLARQLEADRRARARQADRGADQGAVALLLRARLCQDCARRSSRCDRSWSEAEEKRKQLDAQIPTTLVFREKAGEPKPAFMLKRGEYDQKGEKVGRAVPAFLPPLPRAMLRSTAWDWPSGWSPPTTR